MTTPWGDEDPWIMTPPQPAAEPEHPAKRSVVRRLAGSGIAIAVAFTAVGAAAGAAIEHGTAPSSSTASSGTNSPNGNGAQPPTSGGFGGQGFGGFGGSTGSGTGTGSKGSTTTDGPTDAAAIAKDVDPGLVDITTNLGYADEEAAGTGMVLTSTGEILTNNHVIDGATAISVRDIGNGKTYKATVVGYDRTKDIAVIQLTDASGLTTVKTATSEPSEGAAVVGIGNAGGTGGTPSYAGGAITKTDASITAHDDSDGTSEKLIGLLGTDADIQAGDSGGPLVDTSGDVVAMDTAASEAEGFSLGGQSSASQGFAIPITSALAIVADITAGEASSTVHIGKTALLGIGVSTESTSTDGAVVANLLAGGPAKKSGLTKGDVITNLDGHSIDSASALTAVMTTETVGAAVTVDYKTAAGVTRSTTVTLASGPPQ